MESDDIRYRNGRPFAHASAIDTRSGSIESIFASLARFDYIAGSLDHGLSSARGMSSLDSEPHARFCRRGSSRKRDECELPISPDNFDADLGADADLVQPHKRASLPNCVSPSISFDKFKLLDPSDSAKASRQNGLARAATRDTVAGSTFGAVRPAVPSRKNAADCEKSEVVPDSFNERALLDAHAKDSLFDAIGSKIGSARQKSRYCHLCSARGSRVKFVVCANIEESKCRKVICERCCTENGWSFAALIATASWTCTHCRKMCPDTSRCHAYRAANARRKSQKAGAPTGDSSASAALSSEAARINATVCDKGAA